ncbi:MAG: response regulator transcription factor [Ornithinimicrobium sp.]
MNDYEVIVRGVERMLSAYVDRIRVVELDVDMPPSQSVDLSLYDTFALPHLDSDHIDNILADSRSGQVVVYSWHTQPELVRLALRKGVRGYLSKSLPGADIVDALERIHSGEVVISPHPGSLERPDAVTGAGAWPGQGLGLSGRESEVLGLISQGLTNDQIATRMYLSINTVKTHVRSAYRKIEVDSRPKAVIWGMSHGLAPDRGRTVRTPGSV